MQDTKVKTDGCAADRRLQHKGNGRTPAGLALSPMRREDVLAEPAFQSILALERRRAERSRQPFLLMLVDARAISAQRQRTMLAGRLAPVVSSAIRESDVVGWYESQTVLAVIFTEVKAHDNPSVAEALCGKVGKALTEAFEPSLVAKLVVTVHLFPESLNGTRSDWEADVKLYPDLNTRDGKRRLPMVLKRAMDVAGSILLMLLFAPVLAIIAVAIKLSSKGPVIFKQDRLGQFGKTFQCLKFRTMFADNDPRIHREYVERFISGKAHSSQTAGGLYKITDDPRVTPIGRLLRRTSLDEFPQFWNVLCGEMSLVGPRPPLHYEFNAYDFWHRRRVLEVKPGVTGLWQVMGRSRTSFDDMVRMDLRYCQRWSLWLDLKILLATPLAVFTGYGAY
jgi:lipopolysaccharide/colanic/teichoic acid biosynthesis glycosyltransferase